MWKEKLKVKKDNKIAALHPSSKFLIVCLYILCVIIIGTIKVDTYSIFLIPWFLVVPILCLASGVWKEFRKAIKAVLFIAALIFIVQSLFIPSEIIVWRWKFIKVYKAGLASGIALSFSILTIAGIFIWYFKTTENKEISRVLENSGLNYKICYVFISSLQMVKVLGNSSKTIMNAQKARGVETEGNIIVRSKAFFPSMVPLILGAITNTEERVLTLESKGFDVNGPKTHLFEVVKSGNEKLADGIAIMITVAILIWRILLWTL
ncbi:cobalt ABC transporter permease [Vallitalea longa]|uniref:Cobalt ABC transporter permease n=1 Tax=Vallitalea longa TaxID=2936439 RepID=A0A9W6DHP6_9FIRM|nr:energy-coupling factor transporter transmembrane component T [Vallitalea longa]GKX31787.1 cobalt ABC transporter permease [Vallitalea longa]